MWPDQRVECGHTLLTTVIPHPHFSLTYQSYGNMITHNYKAYDFRVDLPSIALGPPLYYGKRADGPGGEAIDMTR